MTVVSRLYDNYSDATRAVSELERAGIPHSDISIVANNAEGWYSEDGGAVNRGARADRDGRIDRDRDGRIDRDRDGVDDRAEGAAAGAGIGAALGGTAGLLAGLGLLAIPGLGPVVAAGWLASTAALAVAGGATGGLIGALTQSGVSEEDANVYAEGVRRGGTLVTARVPDAERPLRGDPRPRLGQSPRPRCVLPEERVEPFRSRRSRLHRGADPQRARALSPQSLIADWGR